MRSALFAVLLTAFAQAHAQKGILVSPLPEGVDSQHALELTRLVLAARGWTFVQEDASTIEAKKDRSALRVFVGGKALRYSDQSVGPRMRQRNRDEGPQFAAVPQEEIDALRADLAAAFAGNLPLTGVASPNAPGRVLLAGIPAGADPRRVMEATRNAFLRHQWAVSSDAEGALVARNRNFDIDSTLKVFLADGALRFIDGTVDTKGRGAQVSERWLNYIRADLRRSLATLEQRTAAEKNADPTERLRKLKSMLDAGLISQTEYDAKRAEILKGL